MSFVRLGLAATLALGHVEGVDLSELPHMNAEQITDFAFATVDVDSSEHLEKSELEAVKEQLVHSVPDFTLTNWEKLDADGDGRISRHEVLTAVNNEAYQPLIQRELEKLKDRDFFIGGKRVVRKANDRKALSVDAFGVITRHEVEEIKDDDEVKAKLGEMEVKGKKKAFLDGKKEDYKKKFQEVWDYYKKKLEDTEISLEKAIVEGYKVKSVKEEQAAKNAITAKWCLGDDTIEKLVTSGLVAAKEADVKEASKVDELIKTQVKDLLDEEQDKIEKEIKKQKEEKIKKKIGDLPKFAGKDKAFLDSKKEESKKVFKAVWDYYKDTEEEISLEKAIVQGYGLTNVKGEPAAKNAIIASWCLGEDDVKKLVTSGVAAAKEAGVKEASKVDELIKAQLTQLGKTATEVADAISALKKTTTTETKTNSADSSECFPGDSSIQVEGKGFQEVRGLGVGDRVLAEGLSYEPVLAVLHSVEHQYTEPFGVVQFNSLTK